MNQQEMIRLQEEMIPSLPVPVAMAGADMYSADANAGLQTINPVTIGIAIGIAIGIHTHQS